MSNNEKAISQVKPTQTFKNFLLITCSIIIGLFVFFVLFFASQLGFPPREISYISSHPDLGLRTTIFITSITIEHFLVLGSLTVAIFLISTRRINLFILPMLTVFILLGGFIIVSENIDTYNNYNSSYEALKYPGMEVYEFSHNGELIYSISNVSYNSEENLEELISYYEKRLDELGFNPEVKSDSNIRFDNGTGLSDEVKFTKNGEFIKVETETDR